MDGGTDRWTDRQTDGRTDGWTDRLFATIKEIERQKDRKPKRNTEGGSKPMPFLIFRISKTSARATNGGVAGKMNNCKEIIYMM